MRPETLLERAREACAFAHAPYSRYRVGAALLTRGGEVITGCNIESCSYGLTICAERVAVFTAVSAGIREFEAIAVAVDRPGPVSLCGACRQVLWEFAPDLVVITPDREGNPATVPLRTLLPDAFDPRYLK